MDQSKIEQLKDVKDRFRALPAKDREQMSIAMLKVNLGVNSQDDLLLVQTFLDGLPLELRVGKLDALLNYLHSTSAITPPEFSGWYSPDDLNDKTFAKEPSLPSYREDDVETLKDQIPPFRKK